MALHLLVHLADAEGPITSEVFARQSSSNPVVMRRTMGLLRDAGLVRSEKGHGGGWSLARPPSRISLGEVYDALGLASVFSLGHRTESPGCLVEKAVNAALGGAMAEAEALLARRLHQITLAELARGVRHRDRQHARRAHHEGEA